MDCEFEEKQEVGKQSFQRDQTPCEGEGEEEWGW